MTDIANNNFTVQQGDEALKNENYELASSIFLELWNDPDKQNGYLLSRLGKSLRKEEKYKEFVDICRALDVNKKYISNQYVQSELCWCLYHAHIKTYTDSEQEEYNNFINRAKYIVEHSHQMSADMFCVNPYVLTVIKVVKVMKQRASKPYKNIIEWLNYLNPSMLPCDAYEYVDERGKQRELASPKESYYYIISKAYEQTKEYEKCIDACNAGLAQVEELHYNNHIWLRARKHYCQCLILDDNTEAIAKYLEIADKEQHWYMYHKLSTLFFMKNQMDESLLYACKAYLGRFEYEKMVNLLFDTGLLWLNRDKTNNAKAFFHTSAYYRRQKGWRIPEELDFYIFDMGIDVNAKPNINQIMNIADNYVDDVEGTDKYFSGIINNIKADKKFGFISPDTGGDNVYFKLYNVKRGSKLYSGDKVLYLVKEVNGRTEAISVRKRV